MQPWHVSITHCCVAWSESWSADVRRDFAALGWLPKTYFGQRDRKSNFSVRAVVTTVPGLDYGTSCPVIVRLIEWPQNCLLGHVCPRESDPYDDRACLFP
jgi:hypothetical protein